MVQIFKTLKKIRSGRTIYLRDEHGNLVGEMTNILEQRQAYFKEMSRKPKETEMKNENLWEKIKEEENTPTSEKSEEAFKIPSIEGSNKSTEILQGTGENGIIVELLKEEGEKLQNDGKRSKYYLYIKKVTKLDIRITEE